MDSTVTLAGAVIAVALLLLLGARAMRGKWDLLAIHMSDTMRHMVAFVLLVGTSVGSLWFFSFGRLAFGGQWEVGLNSGGITAATEIGALIAASYVARIDRLILSTKGAEQKHWRKYRRKVLFWFYVVIGCSVVANVAFRLNIYGSDTRAAVLSAVFAGAVPVVLVNLLLIILRPLPIDHTQRISDKARRAIAGASEIAGTVMQNELRALAKGEDFDEARARRMHAAWQFMQPWAGDTAQGINHALRVYAPTQAGAMALPDGGQYFDKYEVMQLWSVPERTAQDWLSKATGARTRKGTRRQEAPATVLYELHGVPAVATAATEPETKPTRNRAPTRSKPREDAPEAQEHAEDAQEGAQGPQEEVQAIIYDAQPVAV